MNEPLLLIGRPWSPDILAELERTFTCLHAWQIEPDRRSAFMQAASASVRAVFTTGGLGISAAQMDMLPKLEIVAVHGVGVDAVDLAHARSRGIRVTNTPGVLTDAVADLALALLLASARKLSALERHVRSGAWEKGLPARPGQGLRGKVAGIFGYGAIGQAVAQRVQACGMRVRYASRSEVPGSAGRSASLLDLAHESDYLFVTAPGGPATQHAVNAQVLAALGPQGTLINVARGSLVDQQALIAALASGQLGGAALDVLEDEPHVPPALLALDNVVLTPHAGSLTGATRHAMGQLALDNLLAHFAGAPLLTPV